MGTATLVRPEVRLSVHQQEVINSLSAVQRAIFTFLAIHGKTSREKLLEHLRNDCNFLITDRSMRSEKEDAVRMGVPIASDTTNGYYIAWGVEEGKAGISLYASRAKTESINGHMLENAVYDFNGIEKPKVSHLKNAIGQLEMFGCEEGGER